MKPILFSTPMVKAILDGRKSQTRRVVKPQMQYKDTEQLLRNVKPPYRRGDTIWVRETICIAPKNWAEKGPHCIQDDDGDWRHIAYRADSTGEWAMREYGLKWKPSIFMPAWACRLFLTVEERRIERLQDITEDDAKEEGVDPLQKMNSYSGLAAEAAGIKYHERHKASFRILWNSINGKPKPNKPDVSWKANPWISVYTFSIREIRQRSE